jgi:hypothetical protein
MLALRFGSARGAFDDLVLIMLATIVVGPLIYLVGAYMWVGRAARIVRVVGFVVWVLVGLMFAATGIGLVLVVLALVVSPTLRSSADGTGLSQRAS